MSAPEGIQEKAFDKVEHLFDGRRQRGKLYGPAEWYVDYEAQLPEPYEGGWQVRVRTWRHWSDASVHLDADTGEVAYRCVDRLADPETTVELTQQEAEKIAAGLVTLPPDAQVASFWHEEFAENRTVARLEWTHIHDGMRVDGDYFWVMIQPETHRLVAFGRKWRTVQLETQ